MEVLQDVLGYSIGRRVERRCNGAVLDGGVATKGCPCTRDKGAAELPTALVPVAARGVDGTMFRWRAI